MFTLLNNIADLNKYFLITHQRGEVLLNIIRIYGECLNGLIVHKTRAQQHLCSYFGQELGAIPEHAARRAMILALVHKYSTVSTY